VIDADAFAVPLADWCLEGQPNLDLVLNVAGRRWINSDGRRNMPSGGVFTGPHERSANGRFTSMCRRAVGAPG
jgi:hypothetical protein